MRFNLGTTRLLTAIALASTGLTAIPVQAQTASPAAETAEARLRRMEAEIRAIQRQVFPGGAGRFFEPEIAGGQAGSSATTSGTAPASTAVSDILTRLDALEAQIARLTAQSEESGNRLNRMETRIAALEPAPAVNTATATTPAPTATATPAPTPTPTPTPTPPPTAERLAAVQAIVKPQTADAGDDEYLYGFRLWEAKLYPEAQQQLQSVIDRYPSHSRISYARNLLGRAFLDDNKPGTAAPIFLNNYRTTPRGDRAPDSLLYLGVSMSRRNDATRACASFAELIEVYPDVASGRLATQLARAKAEARCN